MDDADRKVLGRFLFTGVNNYKTVIDKDETAQNDGDENENVNWATSLSSHMIEETVDAVL